MKKILGVLVTPVHFSC